MSAPKYLWMFHCACSVLAHCATHAAADQELDLENGMLSTIPDPLTISIVFLTRTDRICGFDELYELAAVGL
jgi:hypothetical protein